MATVENSTPLKSVYAQKLSADLERNTTEQARIRGEIESLTDQLRTLENDHELLVGMTAALGETEKVPGPRRTAKVAASTGKATAKKTAAKTAAAGAAGQNGVAKKVPLTELIHQFLTERSEPRTAGEIAKALAKDHPDRNTNENLVRTSTERLVALSRAERTKQGRTVYYTA